MGGYACGWPGAQLDGHVEPWSSQEGAGGGGRDDNPGGLARVDTEQMYEIMTRRSSLTLREELRAREKK